MIHLLVIIPVFEDWPSFRQLVAELDGLDPGEGAQLSVLAVNDGSMSRSLPDTASSLVRLRRVEILDLACNVGHQRAIALGLAHAAAEPDVDLVAVMDGDGEDRPGDLLRMLAVWRGLPGGGGPSQAVVVAERSKRSEPLSFRFGYLAYKLLFRLLTGRSIAFGNFSLFGREVAARLAHSADAWNHLAAAILRSRLPLYSIPVDRGRRYQGRSKLDTVSLLVHGLSAISVFGDRLFARLAVTSVLLCAFAGLGVAAAVAIRLFTDWAVPGWATYVAGIMLIVFLQSVMLSLVAAFLLLNNRIQVAVVPSRMLGSLAARVKRLHPGELGE